MFINFSNMLGYTAPCSVKIICFMKSMNPGLGSIFSCGSMLFSMKIDLRSDEEASGPLLKLSYIT